MILDNLFARSTTPSDPSNQGGSMLFGLPKSGIRVDEDISLNYSAVWAAVSMIAHTMGIVSWQVHERREGRRERVFDSPLARLLNVEPNSEMGPQALKQSLAVNALLWGVGYAEIERNGRGQPIALWPIPSRMVEPFRKQNNSLWYAVKNDDGGEVEIPARDMFAPIGLSFDGVTGISPIQRARESVSMGLAMERYGASFFGNDARPSFVLQAPEKLSEKAEQNLREWLQRNHGGPNKSWKPGVLEQGVQLKEIGMPNDDAQFLESRRFQVDEIARWFNVPPHKLAEMDRATFSNIDSRERMYITEAVLPWGKAFEEEANRKLINSASRGQFYTKFDFNTLMRGDVSTRSEFYNTMFNIGAFSPNDVRMKEDMNPVANGDQHMVPGNMVPLRQAGSQMAPQQAMFDVFLDAAERMLRKEYKAITRALDNKTINESEYQSWLLNFYKQHSDDMIQAFTPSVEALINTCDAPFPTQAVTRCVSDHCSAALDRLDAADDMRQAVYEWSQRGRDVASQMIDAVTEAIGDDNADAEG